MVNQINRYGRTEVNRSASTLHFSIACGGGTHPVHPHGFRTFHCDLHRQRDVPTDDRGLQSQGFVDRFFRALQ